MKVSIKRCFFLFFLLFFVSCTTTKKDNLQDFSEAPLFGMVYNYDNQPCSGALVMIDENEGPRTDINGRFVIQSVSKGKHQITVTKDGYEKLDFSFEFLNKSQVLYLRMISFNQLLNEIEKSIENRNWKEGEKLIERAEKMKENDPVELYLKAILLKEKGDVEDSVDTLLNILDLGYNEPYVYLALADIYQYRLNNPAEAIKYIEEYLKLKRNSEVQERLIKLKMEADRESPMDEGVIY